MSKKLILKSLIAGYIIGISAYIFSVCENKIVGSMLFGIGLFTICTFNLKLFTGIIGETRLKEFKYYLLIFLMNILGMVLSIILTKYIIKDLSLGIICGTLMQIAVASYNKHPFIVILCVMSFLLSNSNHCIAMLYNIEILNIEWWLSFILAIIGNIIGAKIIAFGGITKSSKDNNDYKVRINKL